jgi:hypothetical protein
MAQRPLFRTGSVLSFEKVNKNAPKISHVETFKIAFAAEFINRFGSYFRHMIRTVTGTYSELINFLLQFVREISRVEGRFFLPGQIFLANTEQFSQEVMRQLVGIAMRFRSDLSELKSRPT